MTATSFHGSEPRYGSLRIIATIFTLIGGLLLVLGSLLLGFTLYIALTATLTTPPVAPGGFGHPQMTPGPLAVGLSATLTLLWSFGILLGGLQFVAAGALIRLMILLEANTRTTVQLLDHVRTRLEPTEERAGSDGLWIS